MSLIVRSKIRESAKGMNVSSDVANALEEKVEALIKEGCERAKANGRRTLQAKDL